MMKKIIFFSILCVLTYCVIPTQHIVAQEGFNRPYTLLAPLPGTQSEGSADTTNFPAYISGIYKFTLGVAGILAVIMIIFAGFTYMTTDAFQKKQEGKERIKNAILGLLLAIGTWVILNTIGGTALTTIDLSIERPQISVSTTDIGVGGGLPESEWSADEREARAFLNTITGVSTNKNPCPAGQTQGCANMAGIPFTVFNNLETLKQNCPSCTINISGGSEAGHVTHGVSQPIVDLSYNKNLANYIRSQDTAPVNTSLGPKYKVGNMTILIENEGVVCTGNNACQHFHVVVGS